MGLSCLAQCGAGMGSGLGNESVKFLWKHLKSRAGYLLHYKKKFKKLKERFEHLKNVRNDINRSVETANRRGEVIKDVVTAWLEKVNELETEVGNMEEEVGQNKRCLKGFSPNCRRRYQLGEEATKKKAVVEGLLEERNFDSVSQLPPPPTIESMPVGDFMAFSSTRIAMDHVMNAIEDENKHLIGIYGMGGVGKTTLMEEIGRRLKKDKKFDAVVKVVVSQNPNIELIRRDIADQLGMTALLGSGESAARALATRLGKEKKIAIMLDDIWARLELKDIGIPFGDDHKGCKILLTSRKSEVCDSMESDVSVLVDVLSEEDSWDLFKSKAGKVVETSDVEPVAKKVAKECGGLPLAIVVVGRALRGFKERSVWDDALLQLKQSTPTNLEGVEEQLFKSLELSYKQLKTDEMKVLFLYCCLFREDYDISENELTRYAVGEGLLKGVYSLEDVRRRLHFLVEKLKASCLLLTSDKMGCVKLHDVVRDVAVYIASKDDNHFFVKAGLGVRDWPEGENWEACKRISLMNNDLQALPDRPNCPRVATLLLNINPITTGIPSNFFQRMAALKVLDLSDTDIESLPLSLAHLTNLVTLRLDRCQKLQDITMVENLKKLEILGLQKCRVSVLPEEIGTLVNLKLLDISNCSALRIPPNLIPKLSRLEELYMIGCNANRDLLAEIAFLKRLVRLHVYVRDAKNFSQDSLPVNAWENLSHFIVYNELDWFLLAAQYQKNFYIKGISNSLNWAKVFLGKTEDLMFDDCQWDIVNLVKLDEQNGFAGLKKLRITRCHRIACLLDTTQVAPSNAYGELEIINLWNLENLNGICQGPLPALSFGKIRILDIMLCKKLNNIMSCDLLQRVHCSLEELAIKHCDEPQVIFNFDGLQQGSIILPNLSKLTLQLLPNLTTIWTGVVSQGSLQKLSTLEVSSCNKLAYLFSCQLDTGHQRLLPPGTFMNLKKLKISRCSGLSSLFLPSIVHELLRLERLELKDNGAMEKIVAEENGVRLEKGAFPLLKDLLLINLSNLSRFYGGEAAAIFLDWPSLKYIKLGGCPSLKRLPIGPESAPKLKKVHVAGDDDVEWFQNLEWEDESIPSRFRICESDAESDSD
ncbi:disease resistance protein At4g27190 [Elaeis guineensis]|uniref:Disease resistance protein SUMM2 n=1 Tax=Elaeis guineensis var. tenera TaxID=51953 RepID=A0A6J0PKK0_ELAGV|nr:disease resistance protein SUMM2 [Elaeis guineensis]XP_019707173.1 disease resistance protein SUMM2 [Elaeis guineensis]